MAGFSNDMYVDLVSTACQDEYPSNTGSNFTNKLPVPLYFPEDTYCALEEVSYTNSFYNVKGERNRISVYDFETEYPPLSAHNKHEYPIYGAFHNVELKDGYYTSKVDLIKMINEVIQNTGVKSVQKKEIFKYDPTTLKVHYDMTGIQASIFLKGALLNLLGMKTGRQAGPDMFMVIGWEKQGLTFEWTDKKGVKTTRHHYHPRIQWRSDGINGESDSPVNLAPYTSMAIYADCIVSQVTGDQYSDNLRCLPIKDPSVTLPSQIIHEVKNPYYLKTNKRYFESITIYIKDLQDNFIDFLSGEVRVKLRFRQKKDIQ